MARTRLTPRVSTSNTKQNKNQNQNKKQNKKLKPNKQNSLHKQMLIESNKFTKLHQMQNEELSNEQQIRLQEKKNKVHCKIISLLEAQKKKDINNSKTNNVDDKSQIGDSVLSLSPKLAVTNDLSKNIIDFDNDLSQSKKCDISVKRKRKRKRNEIQHSFDDMLIKSARKKQKIVNENNTESFDIQQEIDLRNKRIAAQRHMNRVKKSEDKNEKTQCKTKINYKSSLHQIIKKKNHQQLIQKLMNIANSITNSTLKLDQSIDKIGEIAIKYESHSNLLPPLINLNNTTANNNNNYYNNDNDKEEI